MAARDLFPVFGQLARPVTAAEGRSGVVAFVGPQEVLQLPWVRPWAEGEPVRKRARSDAERHGAKQSMVNWSCFFEQLFRRAMFCFARWFELLEARASDFARWVDLRQAVF